MTIDADEIIDFSPVFLSKFKQSEKIVGGFECLNMYTSNVLLGGDFYNYKDNISKKNVLFDAEKVTAQRHLDYLWLVNNTVDQISPKDFCHQYLGTMYHATSGRDIEGKIVKSLFYRSFGTEKIERDDYIKLCNRLRSELKDITTSYNIKNTFIGFPINKKYYLDPNPNLRNSDILDFLRLTESKLSDFDEYSQKHINLKPGENWFRVYSKELSILNNDNLNLTSSKLYVVQNGCKPEVVKDIDIVKVKNFYVVKLSDERLRESIITPVLNLIVR